MILTMLFLFIAFMCGVVSILQVIEHLNTEYQQDIKRKVTDD